MSDYPKILDVFIDKNAAHFAVPKGDAAEAQKKVGEIKEHFIAKYGVEWELSSEEQGDHVAFTLTKQPNLTHRQYLEESVFQDLLHHQPHHEIMYEDADALIEGMQSCFEFEDEDKPDQLLAMAKETLEPERTWFIPDSTNPAIEAAFFEKRPHEGDHLCQYQLYIDIAADSEYANKITAHLERDMIDRMTDIDPTAEVSYRGTTFSIKGRHASAKLFEVMANTLMEHGIEVGDLGKNIAARHVKDTTRATFRSLDRCLPTRGTDNEALTTLISGIEKLLEHGQVDMLDAREIALFSYITDHPSTLSDIARQYHENANPNHLHYEKGQWQQSEAQRYRRPSQVEPHIKAMTETLQQLVMPLRDDIKQAVKVVEVEGHASQKEPSAGIGYQHKIRSAGSEQHRSGP